MGVLETLKRAGSDELSAAEAPLDSDGPASATAKFFLIIPTQGDG